MYVNGVTEQESSFSNNYMEDEETKSAVKGKMQ